MNKKKIALFIVLLFILSAFFFHNLTTPYEELEKLVSGPFTLLKTIEEDTYSIMIFSHNGQDELSSVIARNHGFSTNLQDYAIQASISDWLQTKGFSISHVIPPYQAHASYVFGAYDPKVTNIQITLDQETKDVEMDRDKKIWWYKLDAPTKKLNLQSFKEGNLLHEMTYTLQ